MLSIVVMITLFSALSICVGIGERCLKKWVRLVLFIVGLIVLVATWSVYVEYGDYRKVETHSEH